MIDDPVDIVMWSGGPDGTHVLVRALQNLDRQVVALTIYHQCDHRRRRFAAQRAVRRMHPYLQCRIRPFHHVEYSIGSHELSINSKDEQSHFIAMMTAYPYRDRQPQILWGMCNDDPPGEHIAGMSDLTDTVGHVAKDRELYREYSKAAIRSYLGPTLWDMTVSCLHPQRNLQPCYQCIKCQQRTQAEGESS